MIGDVAGMFPTSTPFPTGCHLASVTSAMPRPPALDPLFRSLRSLKGVGPQLGALLNRFFGGEGRTRSRSTC